jgi:cyclic pyranopterin phosphate synthase
MDGIAAAEAAGFNRIKINTVVQKGVNDHTILDLLQHFRGSSHTVRLIEYMDVGNSNHWNPSEVVPNGEWVERISARWPLEAVTSTNPAETARRYRYRDGQGEIGFISSITQPFCGGCTRARVTADGILYTCLFSNVGTNLMPLIRQSGSSADLQRRLHEVWTARQDRYSEERGQPGHDHGKVEMYRLGG